MFYKITAVILLALGPQFFAGNPAIAGEHPCQGAAERGLASVGLSSNDLNTSHWAERIGAGLTAGGEGWVVGYELWTKPRTCEQGYLVVNLTRNCHLRQVYARDGCEVAGAPSF